MDGYVSYSSELQSCASQGRFSGSVNVPRLASFLSVCSVGLIFEGVRQSIERANDYLASSFDLLVVSVQSSSNCCAKVEPGAAMLYMQLR